MLFKKPLKSREWALIFKWTSWSWRWWWSHRVQNSSFPWW